MWWRSKKDIVYLATHDGSFHADEVMATAVLELVYESEGKEVKITRTREKNLLAEADIVYDVGGEYNHATKRYDHHQPGGADMRENGIEYASAGLIWHHYGHKLVEDEDDVEEMDARLFQAIDASDNGQDVFESKVEGVYPYRLGSVIGSFNPTSQEDLDQDKQFFEAVALAKKILERELIQLALRHEIIKTFEQAYQGGALMVFDVAYSRHEVQSALMPEDFPELSYVVFPNGNENKWRVLAVSTSTSSKQSRQPLPESWRGLRDQELQLITGVADAIFCHRTGFMAAAESKEGALALAQLALEAK